MIRVLNNKKINSLVFSLNDWIEFNEKFITFKGFKRNKIKFLIFSIFYSIKSKKIMLGHLNFLPIAFLIKIFNPFSKIFLILHGIECWRKLNFLERIFAKFVDNYISVSNFSKEKFLEYNKFLKNKEFHILPPTINEKEFQKIDNSEKLPDGKIILSVSRLLKSEIEYKGIKKVIEVMPEIIKKIPDIYYVIIGDGDGRKELEKLAEKLNIKDRIIFKGFLPQEKLNFYYKNCNLFILPSKKEGFGIVFLEALYFGKPVIAGNKDASKEPLLNGELGILIDPDNKDEIKDAIIKVLEKRADKNLLDKKYLKEKMLEMYGFDRFKERIKKLIK